jgi:hypothetical protein
MITTKTATIMIIMLNGKVIELYSMPGVDGEDGAKVGFVDDEGFGEAELTGIVIV